MTLRQAGKKGNHGLNYDLGYKSFAFDNEIPEGDASKIVNAYHQAYPMIRHGLHRWVRDQLGRDRTLTNVFGRKRTFLDRWNDSLFKDGYAFPAQSALVDLVNRALILIKSDPSTYMQAVDLLMQIHDSVLGQYWLNHNSITDMTNAVLRIGEHMDPEMQWQGRTFHIANDVKVGLNWAGYHPEHNPTGMMELDWIDNVEAMAQQLDEANHTLKQNAKNI